MKEIKGFFRLEMIALGLSLMVLKGCGSMGSFFDYGGSAYADSHSSRNEEGLTYYFWNESSYDVTIWDSKGNTTTLSSNGGSANGKFNKNIPITDVRYIPADKVLVYRSDFTHVTFRNR
ncbi:MAG: hypothetical protein LBG07_03390 [Treponema sp.]|nr:hypothetical protein [Treponema sp.]